VQALWLKDSPDERNRQVKATVAALMGIEPKDELEGMMAAQLIAARNAAMECFRRAMIDEQTFEGRSENLAQANKLSRTFATLLESLNRHRGKGQQKVTDTCILVVRRSSEPLRNRLPPFHRPPRPNTMPGKLPMHLSPRCGARTRSKTLCQAPAMPNGRCRMHGGKSPGAPRGNQNAFRHGRYSAEAISRRRSIAALLRNIRALARDVV
jgi:hypothetical protein